MAKKKVEYESKVKDTVVDGTTGEVLQELEHSETTVKTIHTAEPPFIKLYVEDMLYLSDVPRSLSGVMLSLLKRATYANAEDGLVVVLNTYVKDKILKECSLSKIQSLNNSISQLVKGNVLKRLGSGTYQFNPYLFGKGEWTAIDNIRVTWDYNVNGRTFGGVVFTNKQGEQDDIQAPEQGSEQKLKRGRKKKTA